MEEWEKALWVFLDSWKKKKHVKGFMVCGSFVTGGTSPHSDIDVHIILDDRVKWRERGNRIVDGFLVEYFANPPHQILEYFREDHATGKRTTAHQFVTGRILWDPKGVVAALRREARKWIKKNLSRPTRARIELDKYHVWDTLDNLEDCFERGSLSFSLLYYVAIYRWLSVYSRFLGYPLPREDKVYEILVDKSTRKRYLLDEFPDPGFVEVFVGALKAESDKEKVESARTLAGYVLDAMGGFEIDGWKLRTGIGTGLRG